jgi:hypothetical protein
MQAPSHGCGNQLFPSREGYPNKNNLWSYNLCGYFVSSTIISCPETVFSPQIVDMFAGIGMKNTAEIMVCILGPCETSGVRLRRGLTSKKYRRNLWN